MSLKNLQMKHLNQLVNNAYIKKTFIKLIKRYLILFNYPDKFEYPGK